MDVESSAVSVGWDEDELEASEGMNSDGGREKTRSLTLCFFGFCFVLRGRWGTCSCNGIGNSG